MYHQACSNRMSKTCFSTVWHKTMHLTWCESLAFPLAVTQTSHPNPVICGVLSHNTHTHAQTHVDADAQNIVHPFPTEHVFQLENIRDICSRTPTGGQVSCHEASALSTYRSVGDFSDRCQSARKDSYYRFLQEMQVWRETQNSRHVCPKGNEKWSSVVDVSAAIKAKTRLESSRSSLRGVDLLPVVKCFIL